MYRDSAEYYDAIYGHKDYRAEAERLTAMIEARRPRARTLLDVACGSGRHLEHLKFRFRVQGLDLNDALLERARDRNPEVTFHQGDMRTFDLGERFDVITCLFSAVGHLSSVAALRQTAATFAHHLEPGGLVLLEPWLTPEQVRLDGNPRALFVDEPDLKIARMHVTEVQGRLLVMAMHHLVATPAEVRHFVERLELFLFVAAEYREALQQAGLSVEFDPEGLIGRGLYLATRSDR